MGEERTFDQRAGLGIRGVTKDLLELHPAGDLDRPVHRATGGQTNEGRRRGARRLDRMTARRRLFDSPSGMVPCHDAQVIALDQTVVAGSGAPNPRTSPSPAVTGTALGIT
jgi:hypothetical protein